MERPFNANVVGIDEYDDAQTWKNPAGVQATAWPAPTGWSGFNLGA